MRQLQLLLPTSPPAAQSAPRGPRLKPLRPALAPEYRSAGSLADDLGFSRESDRHAGARLCLWDAVETALQAAGGALATVAGQQELARRVAAIQTCEECPGAAKCKSWAYRRAWLAAQASLPPATTAWPLKFTGIRRCFEQYQVPLQPYSDPSAVRLRDQLRAGETLTVKGLRLTPLNAWVFTAALAGGGDGQA